LIEKIALESHGPGLLDTLAAAYAAAGRFDAGALKGKRKCGKIRHLHT
jgi:hypothetical protein